MSFNRQTRAFGSGTIRLVFGGLLLSAMALGCSSGEPALIEAAVLDGWRRVLGAELIFQGKTDQPQSSVFAYTDENGQCVLDYGEVEGVVPGEYEVSVTIYTQTNGEPLPAGEEGTMLKTNGEALEKRYLFTCRLEPGPNQLTFRLEDGEKIAP